MGEQQKEVGQGQNKPEQVPPENETKKDQVPQDEDKKRGLVQFHQGQQPARYTIENPGGDTPNTPPKSRIEPRPKPEEPRDSSLKIKVELDLEAEVNLYARVKGDVTIGLL